MFSLAAKAGATREQSMRRRRLKKTDPRLRELQQQDSDARRTIAQNSARPRRRREGLYAAWSSTRRRRISPVTSENIPLHVDRKKFTAGAAARRQLFCCAPISRSDDPGHLWRLYCNWSRSSKRFKELKNICRSGPLSPARHPNRSPYFSLRFLPIVQLVTLNSAEVLAAGIAPRVVSKNSPPCR